MLEEFIMTLVTEYGAVGLAFGTLLALLIKQNKACKKEIETSNRRVTQLEDRQSKMQEDHKNDYAKLAKESINVISSITGCIERLKDAINFLERKS
jgi:hypothetical protein